MSRFTRWTHINCKHKHAQCRMHTHTRTNVSYSTLTLRIKPGYSLKENKHLPNEGVMRSHHITWQDCGGPIYIHNCFYDKTRQSAETSDPFNLSRECSIRLSHHTLTTFRLIGWNQDGRTPHTNTTFHIHPLKILHNEMGLTFELFDIKCFVP